MGPAWAVTDLSHILSEITGFKTETDKMLAGGVLIVTVDPAELN